MFVGFVTNPEKIMSTQIIQRLAPLFGGMGDVTQVIVVICLVYTALIALKNGLFLFLTYFQSRFVFGQAARLGSHLLGNYLHSPYADHLNRNSADLITVTDIAVDQVANRVFLGGVNAITEGLIIVGISILLLIIEPAIMLLSMVVLGSLFLVFFLVVQRRMTEYGARDVILRRERLQCAQQAIDGFKEIKVLGRQEFFLREFLRVRTVHAKLVAATVTLQQLPRLAIETVVVTAIMCVVIGLLLYGRDSTSIVGTLSLFAVAAFRLMPTLTRFLMASNNIKFGIKAVERVAVDYAPPAGSEGTAGAPIPPPATGIEVRRVSFGYSETAPILHDVSATIRRGDSVGIVGASGAGKSTLVDILLGLLSPSGGAILVDGRDIAEDIDGWQRHIGYVPQSIALVDDTIRRNVAFGLDDAEIDEEKIWNALGQAQLKEFVQSLPLGLDTVVGERGARLSGGQQQRIGIARALYRDPEIIVMDEATSALDSETEAEISNAVQRLRGEKTVILIAHRLSTLRDCDRLILLENGRLVDSGSFTELMDRSLTFRRMTELSSLPT